uniref:Chemokine interleukin-8-like domain-containing protein n=1 Tax=Oryzias latipes TaxID=8090 RepID=A0A3B3IEF9_ORYLA
MTNSKACLAAALCSLLFLSTFLSSAHSGESMLCDQQSFRLIPRTVFISVCVLTASCCLSYSRRRPPCKLLLGYSIQTITGSCDLPAVILHLPGKFLCADPSMRWTQKLQLCVEERKRKAAQVLNTSAD